MTQVHFAATCLPFGVHEAAEEECDYCVAGSARRWVIEVVICAPFVNLPAAVEVAGYRV
jgi:hypothetical protein